MRIALLFISILLLANLPSSTQDDTPTEEEASADSFYHVYVRSFKDTNGDGYGDLRGVIEKLDYIRQQGHSGVVLSSIFNSQNYDPSYDVIDFLEIDPIYGTKDILKELISEANRRGLKIILDFVPNHTSDQHEWFRRSTAGDPEYEDFYVFHDGSPSKNGGRPSVPNNWVSEYGGSAWAWNDDRQQYYLHKFSKNQPDLNFRSRALRSAMRSILEFWLDIGVDGFHVDAAYHLLEDLAFRNEPTSGLNSASEDDPSFTLKTFSQDDNETFELLDEWRKTIHAKNPSALLMVETSPNIGKFSEYQRVADIAVHRLFMNHFELGTVESVELAMNDLAKDFHNGTTSWRKIAVPLGNHKTSRFRTRFTSEAKSLALLALQQMLPMTKMIYYGDEIGMLDHGSLSWDDTQDLHACSTSPDDYSEHSRDPQRTPFQWDDSSNAGFSAAKPWLEVHPNYKDLNLKRQSDADFSFYHAFMNISEIRSIDYAHLPAKLLHLNSQVLLHLTVYEDSKLLMINLGESESTVNLDKFFTLEEHRFRPSPRNLRVHYATKMAKELKIYDKVDPSKDIVLAPHELLILTSPANIFKLSFAILSMALVMNYFI